ncbi:DNA repair protein RAD16 [Coemansia spiralis]|uniref:DNA repair protein RAD16 n=2 Tax=Coemansia TaxID=4863 RepID=A0A9W8KVZ3_9FUNG|nr:DNA repair protein RAD16 [Coemansia umbellata]KAJ2619874.1 DNA repair protein RAD16 [Coemansia sp. RSA 1358]KAJ2670798.1 DNA repair protein RAD16 [Coemansia spiralis]
MPASYPLLPFQRQILDELMDEDALCILSRGLGLNRILAELARICATPRALVFLVNANDQDEEDLQQLFMQMRSGAAADEAARLQIVKNETNSSARAQLYRQGGLVSVTSRILVVDLLNKLVPTELATGIIVHNASRVGAESIDAFVLRLVRQQNPKVFVKALSDAPEAFTLGFAPLEKTLKVLGLRHVHLWPRFHVAVQRDMARTEAPVVELRQPQTRSMEELQQAVLDCLSAMISELSSATKLLDTEAINVESCLFRYFDAMIKRQLDPYWHRLSPRVRAMVTELASLRKIAEFTTAYDCVSLLKFLDTLLLSSKPGFGMGNAIGAEWMTSDSANILYSVARSRVFRTGANEQLQMSDECRRKLRSLGLPSNIMPVLEVPPKLELLEGVLEEIGVANNKSTEGAESDDPSGPVLIMTASARECRMIRSFLSTSQDRIRFETGIQDPSEENKGCPRMMVNLLRGFFEWKTSMASQRPGAVGTQTQLAVPSSAAAGTQMRRAPPTKRRRVRGGSVAGSGVPRAPADILEQETNDIATQANSAQPADTEANSIDAAAGEHNSDYEDDGGMFEATFDEHFGILPGRETIVVCPYNSNHNEKLLESLKPTHIIMYDPDPAFIRQIEVYQAHSQTPLKQVYFMVYDNSLEEQRYLSAIRRERESFEKLIKEKATIVIPIDKTFGMSPGSSLVLRAIAGRSNRNARSFGGSIGLSDGHISQSRIVVDVREFWAPLPSLLHAAGFEVVPRTLDIGDYILHDELAVERKSLPDLIGSLRSGRLYNQAEAMCRHYKFATLMVEFEVNTSFSLQAIGGIGADISVTSVNSKLTLLVLAFPRLRIVWSSSPYETASIFAELKRDAQEPDADRAVARGQNDDSVERESIYNSSPIELLQSLPGVTQRNYQQLARKFKSIKELCGAKKQELRAILGAEAADQLYEFIHTKTKT